MEVILLSWVLAGLICGGITAAIAEKKGRSAGWFFLGLFFGPIAILVIAAVPAEQSTAAAPAPKRASVADELGKLAALKDQGLLTDDEFAAQKAKLLG